MNPQLLEDFIILTAVEMKRLKRERQQDLGVYIAIVAFMIGVLVCMTGFALGTLMH